MSIVGSAPCVCACLDSYGNVEDCTQPTPPHRAGTARLAGGRMFRMTCIVAAGLIVGELAIALDIRRARMFVMPEQARLPVVPYVSTLGTPMTTQSTHMSTHSTVRGYSECLPPILLPAGRHGVHATGTPACARPPCYDIAQP